MQKKYKVGHLSCLKQKPVSFLLVAHYTLPAPWHPPSPGGRTLCILPSLSFSSGLLFSPSHPWISLHQSLATSKCQRQELICFFTLWQYFTPTWIRGNSLFWWKQRVKEEGFFRWTVKYEEALSGSIVMGKWTQVVEWQMGFGRIEGLRYLKVLTLRIEDWKQQVRSVGTVWF